MNPIRFGILATGTIAHKFARTMRLVSKDDAILYGVASRSLEKAQAFADEFADVGEIHAYGSYEELLADTNIDAVYVATPHLQHKPCALAAVAAGKHVLCEKPLTLTRADSAEVYAAARKQGVFLMEAMWTRFLPTVLAAKRWIDEGRFGNIRYMTAAFGYNTPFEDPPHPIFHQDKAGGALYDVGVYCIEAALDFFAPATVTEIRGMATLSPSGVDAVNAFLLRFSNGGIANLASAVMCDEENNAVIYGERGKIRLFPEFYVPEHAELVIDGKVAERCDIEIESGFEYEIKHLVDCVRAGKLNSDRITPEATLECGRIFEELMRQGFVCGERG